MIYVLQILKSIESKFNSLIENDGNIGSIDKRYRENDSYKIYSVKNINNPNEISKMTLKNDLLDKMVNFICVKQL